MKHNAFGLALSSLLSIINSTIGNSLHDSNCPCYTLSIPTRVGGVTTKRKENIAMAQAIDPVCGMSVDTETAKFTTQYQGETFYFCSPGCKKAFEKSPDEYVKRDSQSQERHAD